jgi:hypothetical protein
MSSKATSLDERLKGLSNKELKSMLEIGLKEYTEEALAAARSELKRRGPVPEDWDRIQADADARLAAGMSEILGKPAEPAPAVKGKRRWGTFLIVLGAFFVYDTVLFSAVAAVGAAGGRRPAASPIFLVIVSFGLAILCLTAGAKRKDNWPVLFGICLLIESGLVLVASLNVASRMNEAGHKVTLPTVIILAILGLASLITGLVRSRAA